MKKNKALLISWLFFISMVCLAILGGFRNYSPVPFWDMWNGTLGFYLNIQNHDYSAWWSQHNEHRIILSNILFWIDYRFFRGLSVFLIVVNYILFAVTAYVFWLFFREKNNQNPVLTSDIIFGLLLSSWIFLWAQENNFTVGFQSQFILAQLLPLYAFLCLSKSIKSGSRGSFILACIFGVVSAGTMANGILAIPLLILLALIFRQGFLKVSILFSLFVIVVTLYFFRYSTPDHHGHLLKTLIDFPVGYFHFILLYLGSPFYFLLGEGFVGKQVALVSGLFLITASSWIAFQQMRVEQKSPIIISLLFFILYIGGSSFGTAGGRLIFGLDMALASRYTTPAIMAFSALCIAMDKSIVNALTGYLRQLMVVTVFVVCILMINFQMKALKTVNELLSDKSLAALALALNIKDDRFIEIIYPNSDVPLALSNFASEGHYSIFGEYPYLDLRRKIDTKIKPISLDECIGNLDFIEPINGIKNYVRVNGWLFSTNQNKSNTLIRFINKDNNVIGFALTGTPRPDVSKAINNHAMFSGFRGYLRPLESVDKVIADGNGMECQLTVATQPKLINTRNLPF